MAAALPPRLLQEDPYDRPVPHPGPYGLDLNNRPGIRAGRRTRSGRVVPEAPGLPPAPPDAKPLWAPTWLELPLYEAQPIDFWWYRAATVEGTDVPETWFCPVWVPGQRYGREDPQAVCLQWHEGGRVACPWL